jgi:hypothetical protein
LTLLANISDMIESVVKKYAVVLKNGTIIKSTIAEENLLKFTSFIPTMCDNLKSGQFIRIKKLFILRLTENLLIFFLTDLEESIMKPFLISVSDKYSLKAAREYAELPKTFKSIIQSIVVSMAREIGPEPVAWIPETLTETDAFSIAMKTLLNLTGELEGARKQMIAFQPFVQNDALGIVFLFQIPFKNARGGAFDSSITILANYNDRAIIYEKHKELEKILGDMASKFISEFNKIVDSKGKFKENSALIKVINDLQSILDKIILQISKSDVIMEEMTKSIQKLKDN